MIRCQSARVVSATSHWSAMPAAWTTSVSGPSVAASSKAAMTSASEVTSHAWMPSPAAMSTEWTRAPALVRVSRMAEPIPPATPVTSAPATGERRERRGVLCDHPHALLHAREPVMHDIRVADHERREQVPLPDAFGRGDKSPVVLDRVPDDHDHPTGGLLDRRAHVERAQPRDREAREGVADIVRDRREVPAAGIVPPEADLDDHRFEPSGGGSAGGPFPGGPVASVDPSAAMDPAIASATRSSDSAMTRAARRRVM